jgi:metal-dependent hydrolase (beta-lactamase superfamily II)
MSHLFEMAFELTVVSNNQSSAPLLSEHGLSFYIQTASKEMLFDSGSGATLCLNARTLGID